MFNSFRLYALIGATAGAILLMMVIVNIPQPAEPVTPQVPIRLVQLPFDHPSWAPDEETKKRALLLAYRLNGNSMVGDGHMIDVSKEINNRGKPAD